MKPCDTCDGVGWRIEVERGAVHVYRVGVRCYDCRGDGQVPETDAERVQWRKRIYREDIAPNLGGGKGGQDDST